MEMTRDDFENLIEQLWEHAVDSGSLDVFVNGAEVILCEFGVEIRE